MRTAAPPIRCIGRLAPGASSGQARSELNGLIADLEHRFPGDEAASILAHAGFAASRAAQIDPLQALQRTE